MAIQKVIFDVGQVLVKFNPRNLFIEILKDEEKVDFFLKICGCLEYEFVLETIQKIKKIDNVITAYSIDKNTLKSKDFLIF